MSKVLVKCSIQRAKASTTITLTVSNELASYTLHFKTPSGHLVKAHNLQNTANFELVLTRNDVFILLRRYLGKKGGGNTSSGQAV